MRLGFAAHGCVTGSPAFHSALFTGNHCDAAEAHIGTRTAQSSHASETGILPLPFKLSHASNAFTTILP